jgi:UDP-glucuronate decarboxylase
MRLLLTGGTGFFGRALLRFLTSISSEARNNLSVEVLTRSPERFRMEYPEFDHLNWLQFRAGDILDSESLRDISSPDLILHAATDSTRGPRLRPIDRFNQIFVGTENMLRFAAARGASRLLLTSSGAVYGGNGGKLEPFREDNLATLNSLDSDNAYAIGKFTAEHLCALVAKQSNLQVVVARCFAFVGQDLPTDAHYAIGNFIRDALKAKEITVNGAGSAVRSYLYQSDLAEWLMAILLRGKSGCAYNVGSDRAISILDLARLVSSVVSPGKAVRVLGAVSRAEVRNYYVPSIDRAQNELNLRVRVDLADAVRITADALRKNMRARH